MGIVDVSHIGFQSYVFGGFMSQVHIIKIEMSDVELKHFIPQRETWCYEFLPDCELPY